MLAFSDTQRRNPNTVQLDHAFILYWPMWDGTEGWKPKFDLVGNGSFMEDLDPSDPTELACFISTIVTNLKEP